MLEVLGNEAVLAYVEDELVGDLATPGVVERLCPRGEVVLLCHDSEEDLVALGVLVL